VIISSTSAENNHQCDNTNTTALEPKEYWKIHAFYPVIDTIICQIKERFSEESIQIATCVDNLLKLDFEGSSLLINQYKVFFYIINVFKVPISFKKCIFVFKLYRIC